MRIKIIILILSIMLLVGCGTPKDSTDESTDINKNNQQEQQDLDEQAGDVSIEEKLLNIDFGLVSEQFSRKVIQEEIEILEMIAIEKNSFLRVKPNEPEKEVYVYNYKSDEFSYLLYFHSKLLSETTFNIETGEVMTDDEGYADLLTIDAKELKQYFFDLLKQADIDVEELYNK